MTKFSDQLFDDLMREHGPALAHSGTPAHVARKATPAAYTVRNNPDGTVTLAVYQKSGIAGANAKLRTLGDKQVVVVPVEPGCISLPAPPPGSGGPGS